VGTQEGGARHAAVARGLHRTLVPPPPSVSRDREEAGSSSSSPCAKVLHTAARLLGAALTLLNSVVPPDASLTRHSPVAAATQLFLLRLLEAVQWLPEPAVLGGAMHVALVKHCSSSVLAALTAGGGAGAEAARETGCEQLAPRGAPRSAIPQ
jgi:hypothetical protein